MLDEKILLAARAAIRSELTTIPSQFIYLTPVIDFIDGMGDTEIQIAEAGAMYAPYDGSIVSDQFQIAVGIFRTIQLDTANRADRALSLSGLNTSLFQLKKRIIEKLHGEFFEGTGAELTRPLTIMAELPVKKGGRAGIYLKEISFVGGINVDWLSS